jgi:hypothetical protein
MQQEGGDSVSHMREVEGITAALDAYVVLAGHLDEYDTHCTAAADFYRECIPVMKAKVLERAGDQERLLQEVMVHARGPEGLANVHGTEREMWMAAHSLQEELKNIHDTAISLQKTQDLLVRDSQNTKSTTTPLVSQVEAALAFLESRRKLWMEVAAWNRLQVAFSAATLLTRDVNLNQIENALEHLDAAIKVWEEKRAADSPLDFIGVSEAERALSKRLRDLHRAWQSAMDILPKLISASFPASHRLLLIKELSGLRAALDDRKGSIDQVLCFGEPVEKPPDRTSQSHADASDLAASSEV